MKLIIRQLIVLLLLFSHTSCSDTHKHFAQKIKTPDGKYWIALFTDYAGIGDPSWHVYRFDINDNVENKKLPRHKFDDGAIFWNYSEAGDDTDGASISIVKDRYILFTRGGIYYSLYDLQNNKVLINDESPWHAFIDSDEFKQLPKDLKLKDQYPFYHKWAYKYLHLPIEGIINQDHSKTLKRDTAKSRRAP